MRLDLASWGEVAAYLARAQVVVLPAGSTEQHGPMGLIGTDALCAGAIAEAAAAAAQVYVAPALAYGPAPFNTGFPGTVSISAPLFEALATEVMAGLFAQGFCRIYVLNGHGANLAPLRAAAAGLPEGSVRLRSWWEFAPVSALRRRLYGDWEGMHATPSEVAITQALHRVLPPGAAVEPPERLSPAYMAAHAEDRHSPPDAHRAAFPDGRVGSHSALARPEHGRALLDAAVTSMVDELRAFAGEAR